jgi:hypothetical protein
MTGRAVVSASRATSRTIARCTSRYVVRSAGGSVEGRAVTPAHGVAAALMATPRVLCGCPPDPGPFSGGGISRVYGMRARTGHRVDSTRTEDAAMDTSRSIRVRERQLSHSAVGGLHVRVSYGHSSKVLTPAEAAQYVKAGIDVVTIWEFDPLMHLAGRRPACAMPRKRRSCAGSAAARPRRRSISGPTSRHCQSTRAWSTTTCGPRRRSSARNGSACTEATS